MELDINEFPKLPGYTITEQLYDGSQTSVYSGIKHPEQCGIVIKILKTEYPTSKELVKFRNQYEITKNLPIAGIVKPLSLEKFNNTYALIMENCGGISLEKYIKEFSLNFKEILAIALKLADLIQDLHQYRIIHKDIKPGNFLINLESKQIKLIDFSIASLLPEKTLEIPKPNTVEGTLAYISPEQTGRMKQGLDYRCDYYSLGVTLYELFTKKLPFEYREPMELIHAHLAKKPTSPNQINPEIYQVVSDIIMKLMAKNVENRYQSSTGIKHDLEMCWYQLEAQGKIEAFELGQKDKYPPQIRYLRDRFVISEKLYGREVELKLLLDSFARVARGNTELILITGFSGVGKTALVNRVRQPIAQQKGYFIKGKFDQFNRNIPFYAFVQAFEGLVKQLLTESDEKLERWRQRILAALGNNAQVIIDVIPNLEHILGKQPPVTKLSGIAAQNRFNLVFSKFISFFSNQDRPLVIFLDDLQWADSASLYLIKILITESKKKDNSLLILGAYRDNEVCESHPLMLCLQEIDDEKACITTINLKPLVEADINNLVADTLLCSQTTARPLSELIYQKTLGNPFFTTQFLKGLYEDGYINFLVQDGFWQCDLSELKQIATSNNIVEFMLFRLQRLPQTTQDILKLAACIGDRFNLYILGIICKQSAAEVTNNLWLASQVGLVIPEAQIYRLSVGDEVENTSENSLVEYRFLHDRVQQAAYALIPDQQKSQTHYQIGHSLLNGVSEEKWEEHLFEIVNQLNMGRESISQDVERQQLIALNLRTGVKAKSATAYAIALEYFGIALESLSEDCWQQDYTLALSLHQQTAETAYLAGDERRLEKMVQTVTAEAQNPLDTVKTLQVKMQFCLGQNQPIASIGIARDLLKQFDLILPESCTLEDVERELANFKLFAAQFSFDEIVDLPVIVDRKKLAVISTLMLVITPMMIANPNLYLLVVLIATRFSLEHGNSPYSPYGYTLYAIILKNLARNIDEAHEWGNLALRLLETSIDILPPLNPPNVGL